MKSLTNDTLKNIKQRKSVRTFLPNQKLTNEQKDAIVIAFKNSPTWVNAQEISLVIIEDQEVKKQIAVLAGNQQHIVDCSAFIVILGDLYKFKKAWDFIDESQKPKINKDLFLQVAMHDGGITGQSIALALESIGLNTVMVGGIRQNNKAVNELLKLPEDVFPVFGISVGTNLEDVNDYIKRPRPPRLESKVDVFTDFYNKEAFQKEDIVKINEQYKNYYNKGPREFPTWTERTFAYWNLGDKKPKDDPYTKIPFLDNKK